jgi:hypothetical protein
MSHEPAPDPAQPEHGGEGHEGHGTGGAKHQEGHGGGHGGGWLVTYCDMITLLIAFFICIVTFASRESGKEQHPRKRDSLLYGTPGTGLAGGKQAGSNRESIVWRQLPVAAQPQRPGADVAPLYSDPELDATAAALHLLESPTIGTLAESYSMRVPMGLLFTADGQLTPSGEQLLSAVAGSLRRLPYDILIQVDDARYTPRAVALAQHLARREGIAPFRLGAGVRESPEPWNASVWFLYNQRP